MKNLSDAHEQKRIFSIAFGSVLRASKKKLVYLQGEIYRDQTIGPCGEVSKNSTNILDESLIYAGIRDQSRFCVPTLDVVALSRVNFGAIFITCLLISSPRQFSRQITPPISSLPSSFRPISRESSRVCSCIRTESHLLRTEYFSFFLK